MGSLWPVSGEQDEIIDLLSAWLSDPDEPRPLVIETSGSTGEPKRVRLSRRALLASADATHARLGGPRPWTLLVPATYVAGVQVIVRSLRAGFRPFRELGGEGYLSLVPTQLSKFPLEDLVGYDAVLVGGARVDPHVRARAEERGVRVVATYGMSETCGGCVYDGVPLDGVSMRIGDDGLVRLKGPMLFDGYDDQPAPLEDGWFVTSDRGEIVDGRLKITGRADDMINSGGLKVPAAVVRDRIVQHPLVAAAEVVGVPDPVWGERVVAFIEGPLGLPEVRDWVAQQHPRVWAPQQLIVVSSWPMLANGKVDRLALRSLA